MSEETESKKPAAAKKEKPPAVEDKPFAEFIEQDYLPALKEALKKEGLEDLELKFAKEKLPKSLGSSEACWQVVGKWQSGKRQFNVYFPNEDIKAQKVFSCATNSSEPSVIEPFLGDERRINLGLLVFGVVQRLNAQKWLNRN
ncbi:MAG: DUF2996 domain-containing protein [Cyanobacteriota bacterium]|nr:DUF2996 domain-containing protein [Cyanobacteriota bacterium]